MNKKSQSISREDALLEIARISDYMAESAKADRSWMNQVLIEKDLKSSAAMAAEIDRLKMQNRKFNDDSDALAKLRDENSKLQSKIIDVTQRCDKATARVRELTEIQKVARGGEDKNDQKRKEKEMCDLVAKIEQQMLEAATNKAKSDEQIAALTEKLSLVKRDAEAWKVKNEELDERLTEANTRLNSCATKEATQESLDKEQREKIEELKGTIAANEMWVKDTAEKLEVLAKRLRETESGKRAAEKSAINAEKELLNLEKKHATTEKELQATTSKYELLKNEKEMLDSQQEKWQQERSDFLEKVRTLESAIAEGSGLREVLRHDVGVRDAQIATLTSNYEEGLSTLRADRDECKRQCEEYKQSLSTREDELKAMEEAMAELNKDLELSREECKGVKQEKELVDKYRDELQEKVVKLAGREDEAMALHKKDLQRHHLDIEKLKKDLLHFQNLAQLGDADKKALETKLNDLHVVNKKLEGNVASLQNTLDSKERDETLAVEAFEEELTSLEAERDEALSLVASLKQELLVLKLSQVDTNYESDHSAELKFAGCKNNEEAGLLAAQEAVDIEENGIMYVASASPPTPRVMECLSDKQGNAIPDDSGQSLILFLTLGSFSLSVSRWDILKNDFVSLPEDIPVVSAVPKNAKACEYIQAAIVSASASQVEVFSDFSRDGCFVGVDAHYVCYGHPDRSLRGNVIMDAEDTVVCAKDGHVHDTRRLGLLLRQAIQRACIHASEDSADGAAGTHRFDWESQDIRIAVGFKSTYYEEVHLKRLVESVLEVADHVHALPQHRLCLYGESLRRHDCLGSLSTSLSPSSALQSCLIVDIGSRYTNIVPIYEQMAMNSIVKSCEVGGESITESLELMLHASQKKDYAQCTSQRRKLVARAIKETNAYIAVDFEEEVEDRGSFEFVEVHVGLNDLASPRKGKGKGKGKGKDKDKDKDKDKMLLDKKVEDGRMNAEHRAHAHEEELHESAKKKKKGGTPGKPGKAGGVSASARMPDGSSVEFSLGPELYYCTEELFQPGIVKSLLTTGTACEAQKSGQRVGHGIVETILETINAVDESVRDEVCSTVFILGGTAQLRGMKERLQRALTASLSSLQMSDVKVVVADKALLKDGAKVLLQHPSFSGYKNEITAKQFASVLSDEFYGMLL